MTVRKDADLCVRPGCWYDGKWYPQEPCGYSELATIHHREAGDYDHDFERAQPIESEESSG